LSGLSFIGSDIGGFIDSPNGELYVRWLQMGIFHPFCRTHSSGDHGDQEPWSFGEPYTSVARKFIELRYQLLHYIYTTFWQCHKRGTPMLRSLVTLSPDDPETHRREEEFALGDALLICPISEPEIDGRTMYLPKGTWVDFWTDGRHAGNQEIWVKSPLDEVPLMVRAGSVLPMGPTQQYVNEEPGAIPTLHLYLPESGETGHSEWYEDAGDGDGPSLFKKFRLTREGLEQTREGAFQEAYGHYLVVIHGLEKPPTVMVDDMEFLVTPQANNYGINGVPREFRRIRF
jgi:alpha-glucosidase